MPKIQNLTPNHKIDSDAKTGILYYELTQVPLFVPLKQQQQEQHRSERHSSKQEGFYTGEEAWDSGLVIGCPLVDEGNSRYPGLGLAAPYDARRSERNFMLLGVQ